LESRELTSRSNSLLNDPSQGSISSCLKIRKRKEPGSEFDSFASHAVFFPGRETVL